jgi:hypothetical protein
MKRYQKEINKMLNVYIDIETIPEQNPNMDEYKALVKAPGNMKKQETIDKWMVENQESAAEELWLKTSFDGGKGQICCIGVSINGETKTFTGTEINMLVSLNAFIADHTDFAVAKSEVNFIAHNAKFDLPFLHKRFVINGIKPQFKCNFNGRHGQHHYCTMEEWAGFNGRISQDNLCKILGLPVKDGMDGSQVWPEYQKGNIDKIAEYCKSDVETVIAIHKKLTWS